MSKISVAVLGAGMVGVASALALQQKGFSVTLIDRRAPGEETSYGNAGVIARSSLMPFNNPGLFATLPTLLNNQSASFRYRPQFLLANLGWATQFLANARASTFRETTTALDSLIRLSMAEHLQLLRASGAAHHMRDNGWLFLYRQAAAFAGGALARERMAHFGVATEVLEHDHIRQLEPALNPIFERALWIKDTWSVDNPGAVVKAYADLFRKNGGQYLQASLKTLQPLAGSRWRVLGDAGGAVEADRVVVALGPWSRNFMATLGVKVPMAYERGYHMHFAPPIAGNITRPIYDTAGAYVMSPMEQGLRVTSGVELTDLDAPPNTLQLNLAEAAARQAVDMGERLEEKAWLGRRPTLPDSRPIIGAMPGHRNLWLAFGHQHIGFSTGPGTGLMLAALMSGETSPIDAAPFRAERFLKG